MARRRLDVTLGANVSRFKRGFRSARATVQNVKRRVVRAVQLMSAAVVAAGAAAAKMAADFEQEMTRLNTLVGISREQVQAWGGDIQRIAVQTGQSAQELTKAMFAITSGGLRGTEALNTLEQAAKAGAIGLGDVREVGRTATAALQAFADNGLTAEKAIDTMVATVRAGNLVASDLAGALGKVIGPADAVGISFEDLNAFMATFTRLGVDARVASTSLRSAITTGIIKPTDQARRAFEQIGIPLEEFRRKVQEDLAGAMVELVQASEGNLDIIGELIPNVRALSGVLGTAGSQADEFRQIQEDIRNSLGLTQEGFETVQETASFAMAQLREMGRVLMIQIGDQLLPIIVEFANRIQEHLPAVAETIVQSVGKVVNKMVDLISFFKTRPIAGQFGLVGLVLLGPKGAAGLTLIGTAIDGVIAKLFPTTIKGQLEQKLENLNAQARVLQHRLRVPWWDNAKVRDDLEKVNNQIVGVVRTIQNLEEEGVVAEGSFASALDEVRALANELEGFELSLGGVNEKTRTLLERMDSLGISMRDALNVVPQLPEGFKAFTDQLAQEWQSTVDDIVARTEAMNDRLAAEFAQRGNLQRALQEIRDQFKDTAEQVEIQVGVINMALKQDLLTEEEAQELIDKVRETGEGVAGEIEDMEKFVKQASVSVGESLIQGIILGADNLKDMLRRFMANLASKFIISEITGFLESFSPARKLIPVGESVVMGMIVGIQKTQDQLAKASQQAAMNAVPRIPAVQVPGSVRAATTSAVSGVGGTSPGGRGGGGRRGEGSGVTVLAEVTINASSLEDARNQIPKLRRRLAEELTRIVREDPGLHRKLMQGGR